MTSAFFFFNDTATTEIYSLSLHDALPILCRPMRQVFDEEEGSTDEPFTYGFGYVPPLDRKSTRLNSSHANISYAVLCFKTHKHLIHTLSCWIPRYLASNPMPRRRVLPIRR